MWKILIIFEFRVRHGALDCSKFKSSSSSSFGYEPRFERDFVLKRFKDLLVVMNGHRQRCVRLRVDREEKKFATKSQIRLDNDNRALQKPALPTRLCVRANRSHCRGDYVVVGEFFFLRACLRCRIFCFVLHFLSVFYFFITLSTRPVDRG